MQEKNLHLCGLWRFANAYLEITKQEVTIKCQY